jgi:hypothetical protein
MAGSDKYAEGMQKAILAYADSIKDLSGFYMGPSYRCPNCTEALSVDKGSEFVKGSVIFRFRCRACKWHGVLVMASVFVERFPGLVKENIDDFLSIDPIEQTERELEQEVGRDERYDFPF